ncbi:MAG: hypothetical protein IH944_00785 [Armatimonadetes bacterium]|nr:hypothetical protein [Armatimonadota bacterium]
MDKFRPWFYAAAAYNLLWGLGVIVFAQQAISMWSLQEFVSVPFLQVLGMMVGVFAYGYWLVARDPVRYADFIWIGLAGKLFGISGFLFYAFSGVLPWNMGWMILFNDVVWLPAFVLFLAGSRKSDA